MRVLELFSGTSSIGRAFAIRGHEVATVDWDESFRPTACADIGCLGVADVRELFGGGVPDVVWASPDCTTYSVAALGRHRRRDPETGWLMPVTAYAKECDAVNQHLMRLIEALEPDLWFIENPRASMRRMPWMDGLPRWTVTYCQYGERYMKPTDIWTNHPSPRFKPPCKNGDPCHERAPRGSKSGLQRVDGKAERGRIPRELCEHIVDICEEWIDRKEAIS